MFASQILFQIYLAKIESNWLSLVVGSQPTWSYQHNGGKNKLKTTQFKWHMVGHTDLLA